ncbi:MAG: nickel pincer cofactor biosynthesis protein LarC [Ignavibacteriales bacterium]|nr:nickel pincer cofactor biosynthesis protein LarC [Ignavibacteriales bacterium]
MKIAYFDTIAGISGDMTLGAFVSAGFSVDELSGELTKLNLSGFELEARHLERSGIVAVKVDVVVSDHREYHRNLKDINELIDRSSLNQAVRDRAKSIFHEVGVAEAKVHDSTLEKIHFHEVGAVDSLVDIVGTAVCLEHFGIESVYSSPVKLGHGGFVNTQHGKMPVPTPATVEILKGYPTMLTEVEAELTTPTGAAIIKSLSKGVLSSERIRIENIGYGAGSREIPEVPNLLRIMIGELDAAYSTDEVVSIETNIDDMNPEIFPYVIEQLLSAGAHDAYVIPVIMKKGRPGMLLSSLGERSKLDALLNIIFQETTTLGVRIQPIERRKLERRQKQVNTSLGVVRAKAIVNDGTEMLVPEFEECKRIARERNMPLIEVYKMLEKELRA